MAKKEKKPLQIPFDADGNLLAWVDPWRKEGVVFKDNFTFTDRLTLVRLEKGRSAVNAIFQAQGPRPDDRIEFSMFLVEFEKLLLRKVINHGTVKGTWTFRKQGSSYSICLVDEPEQ